MYISGLGTPSCWLISRSHDYNPNKYSQDTLLSGHCIFLQNPLLQNYVHVHMCIYINGMYM